MGFLMALSRKINLEHRQNNIQYQLADINSKMNDYTDYASILSQDSVSLTDIASLPTSLFGAGMMELTAAHGQALQLSSAQMNQMIASGMFGDGSNQFVVQLTQQKLYENARKEIQKQMKVRLNEEEKSLQAKKTRLETQEKQIQQELQALDQSIANGVKSQISTYGLQG